MSHFHCSSSLQFYGFQEPSSDATMLVVGRVMVEVMQSGKKIEVVKENIQVGIMGLSEEGEKLGLWAKTDENGYFALADVPVGEYALKGIRVNFDRASLVTLVNELYYATNNYEYDPDNFFIFEGRYFPFAPIGRVVSLQHNIFLLSDQTATSYQVQHVCQQKLMDYKLVSNEILNEGTVEDYFIEKYPTSAWKDALEESAQTMQFPR